VEIQNRHFLIDCGEGTQMQLMRFQLPYHKVSHIFISHLHGDHYLGLTGLLFSLHLQRRVNDLHIHSQRGLEEILLLQLKYSRSVLNFKVFFHYIESEQREIVFEDEVLTVETIPLVHKIPCTGFLFREKKKPRKINKEKLLDGMLLQHIALLKTGVDILNDTGKVLYKNEDFTLPPKHSCSYAYCSDTAFSKSVIDQIRGVDLLYHEATFLEDEKDKATETRHSTAAQAATIAKEAAVHHLLIGHFSARYRELEPALEEAQPIFPKTSLAIEGKIFEIDA
jgi:ribonuclease Z